MMSNINHITLFKFDTMLMPASAVEKATGKMQWAELKVILKWTSLFSVGTYGSKLPFKNVRPDTLQKVTEHGILICRLTDKFQLFDGSCSLSPWGNILLPSKKCVIGKISSNKHSLKSIRWIKSQCEEGSTQDPPLIYRLQTGDLFQCATRMVTKLNFRWQLGSR